MRQRLSSICRNDHRKPYPSPQLNPPFQSAAPPAIYQHPFLVIPLPSPSLPPSLQMSTCSQTSQLRSCAQPPAGNYGTTTLTENTYTRRLLFLHMKAGRNKCNRKQSGRIFPDRSLQPVRTVSSQIPQPPPNLLPSSRTAALASSHPTIVVLVCNTWTWILTLTSL